MSVRRDIVKVFLGSPGDLVEERKVAKRIVDEENRNHAIPQGCQFELVGWEDTVAQHGRAQAVINRDLDQCNYFIGVLWKRWGSPPGPRDGPYSSGFEEEYKRSEARYKSTGTPKISLLFKSINSADSSDAGPQLQKVLEFKKTFTDNHQGVYHTFDDLRNFEDRFRSILAMFLRSEAAENSKVEAIGRSRTLDVGQNPEKPNTDRSDALFEKDARDFISNLVARPSDPKEYEYTAAEAARLRLLGATLKRSENDEAVVGVHDANILYKEFRSSEISKREIRGLLAAGLRYFSSQNAPLWTWLSKLEKSPLFEVSFRTLIGSDSSQRINAFQVLVLFPDDLSELDGPIERDHFVDWWLKNKENDLVVAALTYLGRRGISEDLPRIDNFLDASEATISKAAVSAKTGILLREGVEPALEFISKSEDADVSDLFANMIFANPEAIRTDLLRRCLSNRSTRFRRRVAQELLDRNELLRVDGDALVQSSDAQTRLLGSLAIRYGSPSYSLSDARDHIAKPKKQNAGYFFTIGSGDLEGKAAYESYKHVVLCAHLQTDLEQLLVSEGLYSHDITFALYDKCFSKYRSELVKNLDDGFSSFLEDKISRSDPSAAPDNKVGDFIRQKMVQQAVELLAVKNFSDGIQTLRRAVDRGGVEYSDKIARYLEKNGGWEDVSRLIQLCENFPSLGMSRLSVVSRHEEYKSSAKAILKLAKNRVADLLAMKMPSELWNAVIAAMSKSSFVSFDDDCITTWLREEADSRRKAVALKSVICLPKSRLKKLLDAYISDGERYYYNVVSWLDLGVSLDRTRSIQIAKSASIET